MQGTSSSASADERLRHRLIERGPVADFTAAAQMLGISQPRLTHVMSLMLLAPEIQAAILLGEMHFGDKELRALARVADWDEQMAQLRRRPHAGKTHLVQHAQAAAR
jgi:hypothetical protein